MKTWVERVTCRLARDVRRGLGPAWVVAVSGGGDSVALLRVLHSAADRVGLRLSVAHLDHGARGEASKADAAFVAELAHALGLAFDLGQWRPSRASHFESDARRARYDWLTEVARARGASVVAVGHTRDDQAETILHRIVRGTGIRGLAGIPPMRRLATDPVITLARPLLSVSRVELRDYLSALAQPFRHDESNNDLTRTRARIRHELMTKLAAEFNPRVAESLARLGELSASVQHSLDYDIRRLIRSTVISATADDIVLKQGVVRAVPPFLRAELLRSLWRRAGWPEGGMSARRWRRLAALARADQVARAEIGGDVCVSTDGSFLILARRPAVASQSAVAHPLAFPLPLDVPGSVDAPWACCRVEARVESQCAEPGDEIVDLDRVELPLHVRRPAPGDRFDPLGMDGSTMALADFFRGRHVAAEKRDQVPLVCDRLGIIWVVGHRIADRVKRTASTQRNLYFSATHL